MGKCVRRPRVVQRYRMAPKKHYRRRIKVREVCRGTSSTRNSSGTNAAGSWRLNTRTCYRLKVRRQTSCGKPADSSRRGRTLSPEMRPDDDTDVDHFPGWRSGRNSQVVRVVPLGIPWNRPLWVESHRSSDIVLWFGLIQARSLRSCFLYTHPCTSSHKGGLGPAQAD